VGWANSYYANESYANGAASYTEEWGIGWKSAAYETRFGSGFYTEIALHPLADVSALETYTPPDPNSTELYEEAAQLIASYKQDYWIVGVTVTTIFETVWRCAALSGC
jgi:uroporphyrinogen decarboxylase